jgi:branched-chain amino acid transport system substrate-binding protein
MKQQRGGRGEQSQGSRASRLNRRETLQIAAAAAAALSFSAPRFAIGQSRPPIRIGILNTFSKVFASLGESNSRGNAVVFEQNNWELAGRRIELIREDDELSPQTGLDKARKLVESDKVDFILGLQATNVALALLPYLTDRQVPTIMNAALTAQSQATPYTYRASFSAWQLAVPMAGWIYDNVAKEIVITASDYAFGHDVAEQFRPAFEKRGGKVLEAFFPPLGTADFSPYLSRIKAINPPATYNFYAGADAVRFINQYVLLGLKDTIRLTGWTSLVNADALSGTAGNAIGCATSSTYADTLDTPENKMFVDAYVAKNKQVPDFYANFGYTGARILTEAVKAVDGDLSNRERVAKAIEAVSFKDPRGPFRFDAATHIPIQNVYVLRTDEKAGTLSNNVIHTFPDVRDPGPKA